MEKILLIVTGPPGSGKTSFSSRLCAHYPHLQMVSYDAVKEEFFDQFGFDSAEEKLCLNERSLQEFYVRLGHQMEHQRPLLIEYPFCLKHRSALDSLLRKYEYQAVTILLMGDLRVLYERGVRRDRSFSRHPGHLLNAYHHGGCQRPCDFVPAMSYEQFADLCREKDYDIRLGTTIQVDVTDIQDLDYDAVFSRLDPLLSASSSQTIAASR